MDGQSYLLLIRDEGGPRAQVALARASRPHFRGFPAWDPSKIVCGAAVGQDGGGGSHAGEVVILLHTPQFAAWVDAVVFVFSLEDEISFQTVQLLPAPLQLPRNTSEVPMVLVGTQGGPGPAHWGRPRWLWVPWAGVRKPGLTPLPSWR